MNQPELQAAASDDLQRIVRMSEVMVRAEQRVEELTEQLRVAKSELERIATEDLPTLMSEIGLKEITLADGAKLSVNPDVSCSISEARRPEAHAWLEEHGFGGLIKSEVRLQLGREELERAREVAEQIGGFVVEQVHPATLKSFVKEQRAAGVTLPEDLFGIQPYDRAKLVRPRR